MTEYSLDDPVIKSMKKFMAYIDQLTESLEVELNAVNRQFIYTDADKLVKQIESTLEALWDFDSVCDANVFPLDYLTVNFPKLEQEYTLLRRYLMRALTESDMAVEADYVLETMAECQTSFMKLKAEVKRVTPLQLMLQNHLYAFYFGCGGHSDAKRQTNLTVLLSLRDEYFLRSQNATLTEYLLSVEKMKLQLMKSKTSNLSTHELEEAAELALNLEVLVLMEGVM